MTDASKKRSTCFTTLMTSLKLDPSEIKLFSRVITPFLRYISECMFYYSHSHSCRTNCMPTAFRTKNKPI